MQKSELKTGMVIETRAGEFGMVLRGMPNQPDAETDFVVAERGASNRTWGSIDMWNDDLTSIHAITGKGSDIVRVYDTVPELLSALDLTNIKGRKILFDREQESTLSNSKQL